MTNINDYNWSDFLTEDHLGGSSFNLVVYNLPSQRLSAVEINLRNHHHNRPFIVTLVYIDLRVALMIVALIRIRKI